MTELRDIQKRALAQIRPTGITPLWLPTGSGKSILAYAGSDNLQGCRKHAHAGPAAAVRPTIRGLTALYLWGAPPRIASYGKERCAANRSRHLLHGGTGVEHDARLR